MMKWLLINLHISLRCDEIVWHILYQKQLSELVSASSESSTNANILSCAIHFEMGCLFILQYRESNSLAFLYIFYIIMVSNMLSNHICLKISIQFIICIMQPSDTIMNHYISKMWRWDNMRTNNISQWMRHETMNYIYYTIRKWFVYLYIILCFFYSLQIFICFERKT